MIFSYLVFPALLYITKVAGQNAGCIQLSGSAICPGFSDQYINPSNLAEEWPFFADVTDVSSFDTQLANYLVAPDAFITEKYVDELGCSNTSSTFVLQYARTFLCSQFTQISYTAGCYTGTNVIRRMACQQTCLQFASSENYLVNDDLSCGPENLIGNARQGNLTADFTACTDWTTLSSNNTATCVLGQNNEPNCGFGSSRTQLCNFCNPQSGGLVGSCCGGSNVNLDGCGYTLSAAQIESLPSGVASAGDPSATAAAADLANQGASSSDDNDGLSGGAIAGIVIGVLVGVAKLGLLAWFCCYRRKRNDGRTMAEEYGIIAPGKFGSHRSDTSSSVGSPMFTEKGDAKEVLQSPHSSASVSKGLRGGRMSWDSSAYTTSSGEARNLVSSYRDHYSSVNIVPGSVVTAIYTYNANLPDELHLEPENSVIINKIFDDGWASGTIADGPAGQPVDGFFPLVVVTCAGHDPAYDAASSISGYTARSSSAATSFNSAASRLMSGSEANSNRHDPAVGRKNVANRGARVKPAKALLQ